VRSVLKPPRPFEYVRSTALPISTTFTQRGGGKHIFAQRGYLDELTCFIGHRALPVRVNRQLVLGEMERVNNRKETTTKKSQIGISRL
jgi:hypothetical protein